MAFDAATAIPVEAESFDPDTATPVTEESGFDPTTAKQEEPSAVKAFTKGAVESTFPTAGGLAGSAAALKWAAPLISKVPTAPGKLVAGAGIALAGGFPGSIAVHKLQELVLEHVPPEWLQATGMDPKTRAAEKAAYPRISQAGEFVPSLAAFRPGSVSKLERVFAGGMGTVIEGGQQAVQGQFDLPRLIEATALQAGAPKTTRLGKMLFPQAEGISRELQPKNPGREIPTPDRGPELPRMDSVAPGEDTFIADLTASIAKDKAAQEAATKPPVVEETKAITEDVVPLISEDVSSNKFPTRQAQEDRISDLKATIEGGLEPGHPAPIKAMANIKAELADLEAARLPPETREHHKTDIEALETKASDILWKADAAANRGDEVAANQFEAESKGIQAKADELRAKMPEAVIKDKVAPTPEELQDFLWGVTTATQALDKVHAAGIGGKPSLALNRLIRNHRSLADTLFKTQKEPLIDEEGELAGGWWEQQANAITLGPNSGKGMATFYHEMLHPIIQNVLKDNTSRAAIRLEQLWKEVKDAKTGVIDPLTGKPHYGFTDKFEFLAEAYTNASFQRLLQGITYPTTTPGKFTTAWNALKEIIKDAIGAKDAATRSALDEVLEVGSRVIEQNRKVKYEYRPDNNEVVSKSAPVDPNNKTGIEKETGSIQDVLEGKANRDSIYGFDLAGVKEDLRLQAKHTELIKAMSKLPRNLSVEQHRSQLDLLAKMADSVMKQRDALADKYKEHSLGALIREVKEATKLRLVRDIFEKDPDTKKAWAAIGRHELSQPVDERFSTRSRDEAYREVYEKHLTKKDVLDAARIQGKTDPNKFEDDSYAGIEHINKLLNERSNGNWQKEAEALRKAGPTELDRAADFYGDLPDNRTAGEKASNNMRVNTERIEFSRKTDKELEELAAAHADGEVYQSQFEAHQEGEALTAQQADKIRNYEFDKELARLKAKRDASRDGTKRVSKSEPVAVKDSTLPEEAKVAPKPVRVQDIGSLGELKDATKVILETQGEAAARQFYRDWTTYKETWTHPVNEADKAIQTNVNNKTANDRIIANDKAAMLKLEPDAVAREGVAEAIDAGKTHTLTGKAKELATLFTNRMADIGKRAKESGTVTGLLEDYVSHIVEWKGVPETIKEQFLSTVLSKGGGGKGMSPETRFAKRRTFETFADLQAYLDDFNTGLRRGGSEYQLNIKTKDIAEIYSVYAQSMERAIENKRLIEALKTVRNIDGTLQLQQFTDPKDIPRGWKPIPSNQFPGYFADPSLIPSLKFAFDAGPGELMNALGNVSQVVKRLNVIFSLFHAKSLMEVMSSTGIPIWTPLKEVGLGGVDKLLGTKYSGLTKALEQFRKGGLGDSVDSWIKHNLVLETPEDVQIGLIPKLGQLADDLIVKYGPNVRVLEKSLSTVEKYTLRYLDHFTWDYLHTGGKLMVADTMLTSARLKAAKEGVSFNEDAARTVISNHLNKAFGGLNWFAEAAAAKTELGKRMAMAAYSPAGRRGLQVVLFAPDWTLSTIKAFTAALPEKLNPKEWHPVRGIKGIKTPTTEADYARLYQMKTVLTYLMVINALNMVTADRPIWDNKDPTRLEFPDGTSIQVMKHGAEPYHWLADPTKTLANKLGFIPKAVGVALTGNEYLGPTAQKLTDPSILGRAKAIAGSAVPFQVQAAVTAPEGEGAKRAIMGTLGFPELGATKAQLRVKRAEREKLLKESAAEYRKKAKEKGWQ